MNTTCIEWQGYRNPQGYGEQYHQKRMHLAHRVAYVEAHGLSLDDIKGICVLHECDNPPCRNPDHLFLGSRLENTADMMSKSRQAVGRRNGAFRDHDLSEIRKLSKQGLTQKRVAATIGCAQSFVSNVLAGNISEEERN